MQSPGRHGIRWHATDQDCGGGAVMRGGSADGMPQPSPQRAETSPDWPDTFCVTASWARVLIWTGLVSALRRRFVFVNGERTLTAFVMVKRA
jgi:hypothetical protein